MVLNLHRQTQSLVDLLVTGSELVSITATITAEVADIIHVLVRIMNRGEFFGFRRKQEDN